MKKAVIISYYDWLDQRLKYLKYELEKKGFKVQCYTSNFDHIRKERINNSIDDTILIDVPKYSRNISIKRIYSLIIFSKKINKILKLDRPEFVYCILPPNYLAKELVKLKRTYNIKLVFDIIDMWPESLPIGRFKNLFFFKWWKNLRNSIIGADYVITECDRYHNILNELVDENKITTIRLVKDFKSSYTFSALSKETLHLCYLGSINNLIDISAINKVLINAQKYSPVELHIIGDGNNRDMLIDMVKKTGTKIHYYGIIYDYEKKRDIFNKCHYGLNLYKENTLIGLTMKSLDYFEAGLPIINNIEGDTANFLKMYNIGLDISEIEKEIIYTDVQYKEHVFEIAKKLFDKSRIEKDYQELLLKLSIK